MDKKYNFSTERHYGNSGLSKKSPILNVIYTVFFAFTFQAMYTLIRLTPAYSDTVRPERIENTSLFYIHVNI